MPICWQTGCLRYASAARALQALRWLPKSMQARAFVRRSMLHAALPTPHTPLSHRAPSRGLTLIEVMVALAISAVLLAIAAPDFREAIWRARLSTVSMDIVSAIQMARAEAVRQNARAVLCASSDNSSCTAASATWTGWIVFVDSDNDGTRDGTEPVIKAGSFPTNATVTASAAITAVNQRITFGADGVARAADGRALLTGTLAACVTETRPAENVRDVSLAFGVRTAVRRRAAAGACATPADL
jgi:type IV fimbrial biogenesis protein FimT